MQEPQLRLLVADSPHRLKCDRQSPCTACSKRGDIASCSYSNGGPSGREGPQAAEAQLRLQKLEEMVTGLMQTNKEHSENLSDKTSPPGMTVDGRMETLSVHSLPLRSETSSGGHLNINGSETNYVGATHWATILENVSIPSMRRFLFCS
jgi:hypothetical protein